MRKDRKSQISRQRFIAGGTVLLGGGALAAMHPLAAFAAPEGAEAAVLEKRFDTLLAQLLGRRDLMAKVREFRESRLFFSPFAPGVERAPIRANPSNTPISARATDLIVACEVTSKAKYIRSYQRPTWPQGSSGVTIGIGYDIGYVTATWFKEDWAGYISEAQQQALAAACGATGERAQQLTRTLQSVVIGWDPAYQQFLKKEQPRWVGETESALPNTSLLAPDSLGALVSLVYNRGPSFSMAHDPARDPLDRYREMRAIKAHMAAKEFDKIPQELRDMKRIWRGRANMRGLLDRRELEALLFEAGLQTRRPPTSAVPAPARG